MTENRLERAAALGGGEIHELRRVRKRRPLPIPGSACRILGDSIYDGFSAGKYTFALRTRRGLGVEIMMHVPENPHLGFSWNLSTMLEKWPANFREAREWVHAYAAGFGQEVEERVRRPWPRMKGEDRKLFKSGGCNEAWLASEVPELFAEAAVRCRHAGGYCMSDGFCHYGTCDMKMVANATKARPDAPPPQENSNAYR